MTAYLFAIAVGVFTKTLLPMPWLDDRVRAAWSRAYRKVTS